jgi:sugar O-acyltransferase (sialic acid O-acetyltransferase NeuD family)
MKKALIGNGGHSREVKSLMGIDIECFVDAIYMDNTTLDLAYFDPNEYEVMIAIADPIMRYDVANRLPQGTKYFTWIHPTAIISDEIDIGDGSFIGPYSILTTNIKIGKHAILNRANHIGHDCVIGDYFSAMPGSIVSGNVTLGNNVYLGTNSSIREKINICDDVTIGLSSGVTKNITESGVYVGTPSRKIR